MTLDLSGASEISVLTPVTYFFQQGHTYSNKATPPIIQILMSLWDHFYSDLENRSGLEMMFSEFIREEDSSKDIEGNTMCLLFNMFETPGSFRQLLFLSP